ncbi:alpha/beta fold hydrolase [uncultured Fluviicola sp.]|uniref:S9 family peptidase n=1 Tax=uncultured Fluviicola sp. TaxID=463303 RepID=UPI0025CEA64C|nr:alpha/beta fold hydrolase [uncultured Fluviicola sp.]
MSNKLLFTVLSFLFVHSFFAQTIRLEEIMKGEEFVGFSPQNIRWAMDNESVLFDWNPNGEPGRSLYAYHLKQKNTRKVPIADGRLFWTPALDNHTQLGVNHYFNDNGDLARYTSKTKLKTILYSAKEPIGAVFRNNQSPLVYFQVENNLFCYNEVAGSIIQVTNFIRGNQPAEKSDTSFLYQQQKELFSFIQLQEQKKQWAEKQPKRVTPAGIYYAKNEYVSRINISQDGSYVTFVLVMDADEPNTNYESFITGDGFTQRRPARPKVNDKEPNTRMGIFDIRKDTVYFVYTASLKDIRKKPEYFAEYGSTGSYSKDREICFHQAVMHPTENKALVDIRSYDNKDRWICLADLASGKLTELEHQHDEAWIGGPGISEWNEEEGTLFWVNQTDFIFQSEESGYSHLYSMNCNSRTKKALTEGNWEVRSPFLSNDKKTIYFIGNKIHPGVRNGYKLDLVSGNVTALFEGYFGIEWTLSPDEKTWAIRYSTPTQPWELCIAANKPGQKLVPVTKSTLPGFDQLPLQTPEIIQIPSSDGKQIYSRKYTPDKPNGAAVLFVHGAGYLQNAHYYWSHYQREMLFHQLLLSKGYTVLDPDYRASEGYGRNWRTDIYRDMGNRDLKDYVDAKNYLVKNHSIDSNRVGIYGGSYGGFITLMALLKTPDSFNCGAALRSVTDWAHYNHEYTSNILNYPSTDPKAYKRSSPIYFAENLKKPLLMLHGMVDDNVQFQDIVRLNQRFIELGKTNFQLSIFPTEAHGFTFTPAWIDEYRRILDLFETNLK